MSLLNKIAKSVEKNYGDLEVMDAALLFWSFARIRNQSKRLHEVLKSRLDSHLANANNDDNGIYYLEEPQRLMGVLVSNIIE